jgi:1-acyl-sn-glycerol-3-phosphate acyltransferase
VIAARPARASVAVRGRAFGFWIRIVLIGLWLAVFSVYATLLAVVTRPDRDPNRRAVRCLAAVIRRIVRIRIVLEGEEHCEAHQPCVYVANHQGAMDMVIFGSIFPRRTIVIGKREMLRMPVVGALFLAYGNVMLDRERHERAIAGLARALEVLRRRGCSIWLFPEGTRNRSGMGMLPFKKGAFHLAIASGRPIVPVVSSPLAGVVSWQARRLRAGTVHVRFLAPISTSGCTEDDVERLCAQTRGAMLGALEELKQPEDLLGRGAGRSQPLLS